MWTQLSARKAKKVASGTTDDENSSRNSISRSDINVGDVDDVQLDPYAVLQYVPGCAAEAQAHAAGKPLSESIEGK